MADMALLFSREQVRERNSGSVKCLISSFKKLCICYSLSLSSFKGREKPVPCSFEILGYFSGFGQIRFMFFLFLFLFLQACILYFICPEAQK